MTDEASASVIPLHQVARKRAKTGAERARDYRQRKKTPPAADAALQSPEQLIALDFPVADATEAALVPATTLERGRESAPVTPFLRPTVTSPTVTPSRSIASYVLIASAFGLAAVGITINGWFARSLGSTEAAGWLFLAIGVAADLVALAAPSCAAHLWGGQASAQRHWLPGRSG